MIREYDTKFLTKLNTFWKKRCILEGNIDAYKLIAVQTIGEIYFLLVVFILFFALERVLNFICFQRSIYI